LEKYLDILRRNKYKITPQRRAILAALLNADKFTTAQQILEYVKRTYPEMGLDTVYRNLNLLVAFGIAAQIAIPGREGNMYELITQDNHHHHLVCLGCGKAECLDYCPVNDKEITRMASNGFQIVSHSLQFYGYCRQCLAN
jgi:Fe2+ or Zn2+ uptake regulation protein